MLTPRVHVPSCGLHRNRANHRVASCLSVSLCCGHRTPNMPFKLLAPWSKNPYCVCTILVRYMRPLCSRRQYVVQLHKWDMKKQPRGSRPTPCSMLRTATATMNVIHGIVFGPKPPRRICHCLMTTRMCCASLHPQKASPSRKTPSHSRIRPVLTMQSSSRIFLGRLTFLLHPMFRIRASICRRQTTLRGSLNRKLSLIHSLSTSQETSHHLRKPVWIS